MKSIKASIIIPALLAALVAGGGVLALSAHAMPGGAPDAAPARAAPAWTVRLKEAEIARGDVTFEDAAVDPAVKLRASGLGAVVRNIVGDGSERAEFSVRTRFGSGGTLSASGAARWDALAATVRVDARNLDIAALRPYVAARLNATLARAELSGRGTVTLAKPPHDAPLAAAYRGTARVSNLHALDGSGESDLLKWQVLEGNLLKLNATESGEARRNVPRFALPIGDHARWGGAAAIAPHRITHSRRTHAALSESRHQSSRACPALSYAVLGRAG